jgi:two-component system, cell cycle sensor histidine kinase and response regulator CckA
VNVTTTAAHRASGKNFSEPTASPPLNPERPARPFRPRARLFAESGQCIGVRLVFETRAWIGRDEGADVFLRDPQVSRHHAAVEWDTDLGAFVLQDLGSSDGTFLNGTRVDRAPLTSGDRIRVGRHGLVFTEVESAHHEMMERQRLEALGRLTSGIAVDLNNMLGAVISTLDHLAQVERDDTREIWDCIADISTSVRRAAALTPRLLAFAWNGSPGFSSVDVSTLCGEVVRLAQRTLPRSVRIVTDIAPDLFVNGDYVELHQALMSLILEARAEMVDGGEISLAAALMSGGDDASPDDRVLIALAHPSASPAGAAADDMLASRPGLVVAKDIVESHGGLLLAETSPALVRRFIIDLPSHRGALDEPPASNLAFVGALAGQTILVADDEPEVLHTVGRLLRGHGMIVLEARDGAEAVEAYRNAPVRPDVVLLDVGMPELDGIDALYRLRAFERSVRVVFMTGFSEPATERDLFARGALAVLRKPCPADELLSALLDVLRGSEDRDDSAPTLPPQPCK